MMNLKQVIFVVVDRMSLAAAAAKVVLWEA